MPTRYEADRLSTGALADGPSTDVLTTQGFVTDKTSVTDNMPQNSQASLGVEIKFRKFKVLPALHVQLPI
jgi:hypothetical protein